MTSLLLCNLPGKTIRTAHCHGDLLILTFPDDEFVAFRAEGMVGAGFGYAKIEYNLATDPVPKLLVEAGIIKQADIDAAVAARAEKVKQYEALKKELGVE